MSAASVGDLGGSLQWLQKPGNAPELPGFSFSSASHPGSSHIIDCGRWGWLLIARGLIGLGLTVAVVAQLPA